MPTTDAMTFPNDTHDLATVRRERCSWSRAWQPAGVVLGRCGFQEAGCGVEEGVGRPERDRHLFLTVGLG
ncbi:hypothetical protein [Streptomyces sp. 3N207]|uniref:hypothetical protein n=1 Tax=Streptomyces sp. 3N207 TaxID=3457417 RepID=UPI003FD13998